MCAFVFCGVYNEVHKKHIHPTPINTTIYIDRAFDDDEKQIIITAALEWSAATKHLVNYRIVELPTDSPRDIRRDGLLILKINADFPDVLVMDYYNHRATLAFYSGNTSVQYIALISERIKGPTYKRVVLHELGHSLGLEHVLEKDTLMYPYVNSQSDSITLADLKQFCELHRCNVDDLQN